MFRKSAPDPDLRILHEPLEQRLLLDGACPAFLQEDVIQVPMDVEIVESLSADFNVDGRMDLAVWWMPGGLSVLYGQSGGGFGDREDVVVGLDIRDIVSGDFDGDGRADLAIATKRTLNAGDVSVFYGLSSGGFGDRLDLFAGNYPEKLLAGDFDGDGLVDLAVDSLRVFLLHAKAGRSFDDAQNVGIYVGSGAITSGDFNGDGREDLAVMSPSENTVTVWHGQTDGGFGDPQDVGVASASMIPIRTVVSADFNGDGFADLVFGYYDQPVVSVLYGKASGGLSEPMDSATTDMVWSITAADFNGDGFPDIACAKWDPDVVTVYYGQPSGGFGNGQSLNVWGSPRHFAPGDFNHDGRVDLVVAHRTDNLSILYARSDSLCVNAPPTFVSGPNVEALSVDGAAIRGDWAAEISSGPDEEAGQTVWFEVGTDREDLFAQQPAISPEGELTFTPEATAEGLAIVTVVLRDDGGAAFGGVDTSEPQTFTITLTVPLTANDDDAATLEDAPVVIDVLDNDTGGGADPALADFDTTTANGGTVTLDDNGTPADPTDDQLIYTPAADFNGSDSLTYTLNPRLVPSGEFIVQQTYAAGTHVSAISVGDYDADGIPDLAVTGTDGLRVLHGLGNGEFDVSVLGAPDTYWTSVHWADVNGDGVLDLLARENDESRALHVFLGDGSGGLVLSFTYSGLSAAVTGDFNEDGRDDAVVGTSGGVQVFFGQSDGSLTAGNHYATRLSIKSVADFNGDGHLDCGAWSTPNDTYQMGYLLGDGAGGFEPVYLDLPEKHQGKGTVGDFDGDGSLDVATVNTIQQQTGADGTVSVLLDGGLGNPIAYPVGSLFPRSIVSGHFDGDAYLDLVVPGKDDSGYTVIVMNGNGDGSFTRGLESPAGPGVNTNLVTADFNGDRIPDLAGSYGYADENLVILLGQPTAEAAASAPSPATVTVTVAAVNDAPRFSAGPDQSVSSADAVSLPWAADISAGPADEAFQALWFAVPTDREDLFVELPAIAADGILTFTPVAGVNGVATVTVVLHDNGGTADGGADASEPRMFTITLAAPPEVRDDDAATVEDQPVAIDVLGNDTGVGADPVLTGFDATTTHGGGVTLDDNGTPADPTDDRLVYTPRAEFWGTDTFSYTIEGLPPGADAATVTVTIDSVNDAPAFSPGGDVTAPPTGEAVTIPAWATDVTPGPADEAGQAMWFAVTTDRSDLFDVAPAIAADGTLTFTSAAGADGVATVTAVLRDDGGTANGGVDASEPRVFTITVAMPPAEAVDDDVAAGEDQPLVVDVLANDVGSGGDAELAGFDDVTARGGTVTHDDNGTKRDQTDDRLVYTPPAEFYGTDTFQYTIRGVAAPATVTVTVGEANDAPSFTAGPDQNDTSTVVVAPAWATNISPGPSDEAGQALWFELTTDRPEAFDVLPAISPDGTLTYTAAAAATGAANVTVVLHDDGGTANGGVDVSAEHTLRIVLVSHAVAVDDNADVNEDGSIAINVLANDSGEAVLPELIRFDAASAAGGTVTLDDSGTPADRTDDRVIYTPPTEFNGIDTFTYEMLGSPGGTPLAATVTITVTPINDAPGFVAGDDKDMWLDGAAVVVPGWATAISPGPVEEATQQVSFEVTTDSPYLFAVLPTVDAAGTLRFTPVVGALGRATVTVVARDDGGTADGGEEVSLPQMFDIRTPPPVAVDDPATSEVGDSVDVPILGNDSSQIGAAGLTDFDATSSAGGTVVLDDRGTPDDPSDDRLVYTPPVGFTGSDTFDYTIGIVIDAGDDVAYVPGSSIDLLSNPRELAAADLNGDGLADLAVIDPTAATVSVYCAASGGVFTYGGTHPTMALPIAIATADVNGDGLADLIVASNYSTSVWLYLAVGGNGAFADGQAVPVGVEAGSMAAGDFNSDGNADLALLDAWSDTLVILSGDGAGAFSPANVIDLSGTPLAIAAGLINGDAIVDLVVSDHNARSITVLTGVGDGSFVFGAPQVVDVDARSLAAADMDADGACDLILVSDATDAVVLLSGNGDGTFDTATKRMITNNAHAAVAAEVNGDGVPDLAATGANGGHVRLWMANVSRYILPGIEATGTVTIAVGDAGPSIPGYSTGDGQVSIEDFVVLKQHFGMAAGATWAAGDATGDGAVNLDDVVVLKKNFGRTSALPGDCNGDGVVGLEDFVILKQHYMLTGNVLWIEGDFNGDGRIDLDDFVIFKQNFGQTATPAPVAALTLDLIAGDVDDQSPVESGNRAGGRSGPSAAA